jgi:hypothetical protein
MVLEAQGTSKVTQPVLIPGDAVQGPTRMRVAMRRGQYPEACEDFEFGEVEDYTVTIAPAGSFSPGNHTAEAQDSLLLHIQPNPVSTLLGVHFFSPQKGSVRASLINSNGKQVGQESMQLSEGGHYLEFDVSHLPEGSYRLFLQLEKQKARSASFVKIRH